MRMHVARSFPTPQPVMLVNYMLVALLLCVGNLRFPSQILHDFPCPENRPLEKVMTVETSGVFYQLGISNIPPPTPVPDARDVPSVVVYGTGYELA